MQSWYSQLMKKQSRSDLTTNPQGLDDGGENLSGGVFSLLSTPTPQELRRRRKKNGLHKTIHPSNPREHPGEDSQVMR